MYCKELCGCAHIAQTDIHTDSPLVFVSVSVIKMCLGVEQCEYTIKAHLQ